jgi:hypothetical protein
LRNYKLFSSLFCLFVISHVVAAQGDRAEAFRYLNLAQKADPDRWAKEVQVNYEKKKQKTNE